VRKDIFLVGFKATTGMEEQEQYITGLGLLKGASANLVLANDLHTHVNMVITPEEAKYHVGKNRKKAIKGLCEMIALRSQLHFTRSTVIDGDPIPWKSDAIPANLRKVVDHMIARGAYKPFKGKTVGHFATRGPKNGIIYTSRRKTDFNKLPEDGLLRIDTVGEDQVIAHGAKPSVGGQSQRIIFDQHPDVDCIVHAHVPLRDNVGKGIAVREQRPYECGSHECGRNTSDGLREARFVPGILRPPGETRKFSGDNDLIKAVMLDEHGPNICFSKDTDPDLVIQFIEEHWDLEAKTGGPVSLQA
jgi:ribulose-5-phosphate 4-epimerase/fuculose-1-phosphate aldolase